MVSKENFVRGGVIYSSVTNQPIGIIPNHITVTKSITQEGEIEIPEFEVTSEGILRHIIYCCSHVITPDPLIIGYGKLYNDDTWLIYPFNTFGDGEICSGSPNNFFLSNQEIFFVFNDALPTNGDEIELTILYEDIYV